MVELKSKARSSATAHETGLRMREMEKMVMEMKIDENSRRQHDWQPHLPLPGKQPGKGGRSRFVSFLPGPSFKASHSTALAKIKIRSAITSSGDASAALAACTGDHCNGTDNPCKVPGHFE
jgi:hypothetical protein